jgi:ATP-dependent DNA helicase RecG
MARKLQLDIKTKFEPKTSNQEDYLRSIAENDITLCYGPAGTGKAQPLDSVIYTPNGPVKMCQIHVGNEVCTPDGEVAKVTGVFPQGEKDVYKIIFSDGSEVESCEEHLWKIWKNSYWADSKVLELKDFKDDLKSSNGKRKYHIKLTEPVFFESSKVGLDPYIFGLLLGDGCFQNGSVFFSSVDDEIVESFSKIEDHYLTNKSSNKKDYRICKKYKERHRIVTFLEENGLHCKKSYEKFIPKNYIYNSIDIRLNILRGLLDTDGSIGKDGHIEYSTTSKQLSEDVKEIVESLGGKVRVVERITSYTYKGIKKQGRLSYRVNIVLDNFNPFKLSRKANLWNKRKKYSPNRYIESVSFSRRVECQCIMIDSKDHMYLTNNFVQTHNTFLATGMACQYLTQNRIDQIILTRPMVQSGRGLGYLKGDLKEKFEPYLMPLLEELEKFVGKGSYLAEQGVVRMIPLELMRGANFHNAFMILDECQNATYDQMKMFMTRLGKSSKAVLCGDVKQTDLNGSDYMTVIDKLTDLEGVGICKLDKSDIQRNGLLGRILTRMED